jgi:amino acid adenylation domain-containing protein
MDAPGRLRIAATLAGQALAQPPVATWRHHPLHDQRAGALARATLADQSLFGADLVKLTPASTWQLIDHGLVDAWAGDPIGRRRIRRPVIRELDDWDRLRPLPALAGFRAEILAAASALRQRLPAAIPLVATVFNPLFVAIGLAGGERFAAHRRAAPERLAAALRVLQDDALQLLEALAACGVDGVFLAVQHAQAAAGPACLYAEVALPSDRTVLEAMGRLFPLSLLHLHGAAVHADLFQHLPVSFLHYDMAEPGNPAPEAIERPLGCGVSTGPPPALFASGEPEALRRWARDLVQRMAGRPFLLAPGCAVPLAAADAMHLALLEAARPAPAGDAAVRPLDHGGPVSLPFTPFPTPETLLSVPDRFRWVVERHGERPALCDGRRRWTYRELQARVEALATELLARLGQGDGGVVGESDGDAEAPVAVLLPHDARAPMALLAVLHAGRVPVPLDPTFPLERNRRILERAAAALVVGTPEGRAGAGALLSAAKAWLVLDAEGWAQPAEAATDGATETIESPALRPLRGSDPAWLLFTSGTTGEPKGVLQNQRGLLHDVMQYCNAIHLRPQDRLTQLYSASVSGALRDIYGALLNGACLLPLPLAELGAAGVLEVIRRERITVLHAIPGIFRLLLEAMAPGERLPDLRLVYLAGDRIDRSDLEAFRARVPGPCWLYLGIGSTENATLYAHHFIGPEAPLPPGPPPVGRELPDRPLRLLGDDGQPVPIGAIGEVECTSRYLAQGYWRDPQATAERFVPQPGDASVRRFRSGDLARLGADGLLTFVGRRDAQVKIAGRRLEPGEVEAALQALPEVERALVMALPAAAGGLALTAWLQAGGPPDSPRPGPGALQEQLRRRLPEGLVPSRFLWLDRWPLTANGKLDRRALLAQAAAESAAACGPGSDPAGVPPEGERQQRLHALWAEVLGHGAFGIHDSFFLVGGHSLAGMRLLGRLEQAFGCVLPLSALVAHPTIAALEAQLTLAPAPDPAPALAPAAAGPDPDPQASLPTYPASFAQARLWLLHQLEPSLSAYHLPTVWRLEGELDPDALDGALSDLIARHPALRTSFVLQGDAVLQRLHSPAPFQLQREALGPRRSEAVLQLWAEQEDATPLDLQAGRLVRGRLLAVGEREHLLWLTIHHIAFDGWSRGVLVRDLTALYNARRAGRAAALPPLALHVHDFSHWQRQRLQGPQQQRLADHWRQQLQGLEPLALPTDRPRPVNAGLRGAQQWLSIPPEQRAAFEQLCQQEGTHLQVGLLALVGVLLQRTGGQERVAIAIPCLGRSHPALEDLIGFFVNTLPIVLRIDGQASFQELLGQVAATALAALDHQELPFEQMVELAATEREVGRNPVAQVLLQLFELEAASLAGFEGLRVESLQAPVLAARFDLEFLWRRTDQGGLEGSLIYASDLFDADRIARLLEQLQTLLASVLRAPEAPVASLDRLPAAERARILAWEQGPLVPLEGCGLAALVERQVRRTPEAPAVGFEGTWLGYAELNRRANGLAHALLARGVGRERIVALELERSLELVVALLAVLKAGAAVMPLDPRWPAPYRDELCGRAGVALRLDGPALERLGPAGLENPSNPAIAPHPDDLAVVFHTSGTTGTPKAVAMPQRAFENLIGWHQRHPRLGGPARVLQFAPSVFDVSWQEILTTLCSGGSLLLLREEVRRDPHALWQLIASQAVERLFLPSVILEQLALTALAAPVPALALRDVVVAGDRLVLSEAIRRFLRQAPQLQLHNHYGPTETHVVAAHIVVPEVCDSDVPIGVPLANCRLRVLDDQGDRAPIGVPGELHVGGACLALGYRHQPELSARAFRPDPQAGDPAAQLYRTGDLVSWRADGTLAFHGRRDRQIKLRGVRVEPAAIEALLRDHPDVAQAAVRLWRPPGGLGALVAYVVPAAGVKAPPAAEALCAFLQERLPEVMVPSHVVALPALPLTTNGKLDEAALPAPRGATPPQGQALPSDPCQRALHALWAEVLGHGDFGSHDNFFLVGGHSLAAARLVLRLSQQCGREIPLVRIFQQPTIAQQAQGLGGALPTPAELQDGPLSPLAPAPPRAGVAVPPGCLAYDASFAQERLWFLHQLLPGMTAYHLPRLWRLRGDLDPEALAQAFHALLERHSSLRTVFRQEAGALLQIVQPPPCSVLAREELGDRALEAVIRLWMEEEAATPFALAAGPLLRARLLRITPKDHLLFLNHHHIASDGWSLAVLERDLGALYRACRDREPPRLPALRVSYHDYAVWQRQRLQGERLERLRSFWVTQLAQLEPLSLPEQRPGSPLADARGAEVPWPIPAPLAASLASVCRAEQATLQMGLLALVALLLFRHSRQHDLALAVPVWGRESLGLEDLIGCFVNTLPIRLQVDGARSFRHLLGHAREASLQAYAHQELPFEQIVEAVQAERTTSRNPLVSVLVQLIEPAAAAPPLLDGPVAESLQLPVCGARLDLEVHVRHAADGGLDARVIYATDRFEHGAIERLVAHGQTLLASVLGDPDGTCAAAPLLPEAERRRIESWQHGPPLAPPRWSLVERFTQQALQRPQAPALRLEGQEMSYGELHARSDRRALHLMAEGVGPGSMVALAVDRSFALVETLLAILKAGAVSVPLDPAWPAARIRQVCEEVRPQLVLTTTAHGVLFPASLGLPVVWLDAPCPRPGPHPRPGLLPRPYALHAEGRRLTCLSFTSGSTGQPKAVMLEDAAIQRLFDPANPIRIGPDDRLLHLAPISFDAALFEIWGSLLHGACLVLAPPGPLDLAALAQLLQRERISVLWLTAGLFHAMVASHPDALAAIPTLLAGGDVLDPGAVRRLLRRMPPGHRLLNGYGPTEGTTFTTLHVLGPAAPPAASEAIPIGRPLAGTVVRVLDPDGQLCPIGVPGHLHIGGAGLAQGYRHDPVLTARQFVPDPFTPSPTARLYRSGDRVSWRSDGTLAFHGRLDGQLKLRGFRIEPAEIEAHLRAHPAVGQAVVLLRQEASSAPLLVAYWVPTTGAAAPASLPSAASLRAFLAERLPEPMVPAATVALEAFPLTPTGKLDRRALPPPPPLEDPGPGSAPRTELEGTLYTLWSSVLGHGQFGCHDPFFLVGGHSLAAAQLAAVMAAHFARPISVASLFRAPTIAAQAADLQQPKAQGVSALVSLQGEGERLPLFAIHGWGGTLGAFVGLAQALAPHRPLYGLQAEGGEGGEEARTAGVRAMAAAYAEAILQRRPEGAIHLIGYSAGGWYAHAVAEALLERGAPLGLFAVLDSHPVIRLHRRLALRVVPERLLRQGGRLPSILRRAASAARLSLTRPATRWTIQPTTRPAPLTPVPPPVLDPYCELLRTTYRPNRLPLHVDLFAAPGSVQRLSRFWRFYATGGVTSHPLFETHADFADPNRAETLTRALDAALRRVEGGPAAGRS